ncbi:MAG TPA: cytochrome c3 family protein [Thermoleophilia bacterium]|nr:cytochrome c3 family protein [Thermoleophilia bacterium]
MRRRPVLAVVLCLGMIALLGVGASPAAAATCVDCHAVPPDGPPAPHGVLVAAVTDCITCHRGMSPHPASPRIPGLSLSGKSSAAGLVLAGKLWQPGALNLIDGPNGSYMLKVGLPDVTVYLQQRLWADTEFTDLTQVTTDAGMFSEGAYSYTVPSPVPFAAYRAISQGAVLTPDFGSSSIWRPAAAVLLPKPRLTLKLSGLTNGSIALGRKLKVSGTVAPIDLAGQDVFVKWQRRVGRTWADVRDHFEKIGATGAYSWTFTVRQRGLFRIRAMIEATPDTAAAVTTWRRFTVK